MNKQILNIDDTFEAINIVYFGSTEEVGISIYDKQTTNGACGYLTFKEIDYEDTKTTSVRLSKCLS